MTSTTIDKGRWTAAAGQPGFPCRGLLDRTLGAVTGRIGRFGFSSAMNRQDTLPCPMPDHELAAISHYAAFIAAHPDMPVDHKDRFLGEIIRCCKDLRTAGSQGQSGRHEE
jgi:hypothetical protein